MLILLFFAFLAGVATVLSPCILPLLPIVLSSSVESGKRRPFGVVTGFIISFSFFSLFLTSIVKYTGLPSELLRYISIFIIFAFGLSILIPKLQLWWEQLFAKLASKAPETAGASGFKGGLIVGLSLGLIWTPCVGPIMAAVLTLAATSSVTWEAALITLAYAVGTGLPMLLIIYGGRGLLNKVPFLLKNTGRIQKAFGVILMLLAIAIFFNIDRKFQVWVLETFPNYGVGITKIEDTSVVKDKLDTFNMTPEGNKQISDTCKEGVAQNFEGGNAWLGSDPLSLDSLKGKVVLVDFWTYTCINCIRTLPYVTQWYEKYKNDGLVIIGVHTPEFEFEKNKDNVLKAMEDYGITYPVVQDNDYAIWKRYNNRYWPAHYFIDRDGCIRHTHFGEGEYDKSEKVIQELLLETGANIENDLVQIDEYQGSNRTPELYLGYTRMRNFVSAGGIEKDVEKDYKLIAELQQNQLGYEGKWLVANEKSTPAGKSSLSLNFLAKEVYLVVKPVENDVRAKIYLDGKLVDQTQAGEDVTDGEVVFDEDRLYKLIKLDDYENHILKIEFEEGSDAGLYAFTFG